MNKYISFLLVGLGLILCTTSCEDKAAIENAAKEKAYYEEVMAGHDEVMPMTAKIGKLARQMRKYLKENPDVEAPAKAKISEHIKALMEAEEGMFAWMESVVELPELQKTKSHEEIMAHLNKENEIMKEVRKKSISSLKAGKEAWAELQPQ